MQSLGGSGRLVRKTTTLTFVKPVIVRVMIITTATSYCKCIMCEAQCQELLVRLLFHLLLTITLCKEKYYFFFQMTNKEIETQGGCDQPKVTQLELLI